MLLKDLTPKKIKTIVSNFYLKSYLAQSLKKVILICDFVSVHKYLEELFQLLVSYMCM